MSKYSLLRRHSIMESRPKTSSALNRLPPIINAVTSPKPWPPCALTRNNPLLRYIHDPFSGTRFPVMSYETLPRWWRSATAPVVGNQLAMMQVHNELRRFHDDDEWKKTTHCLVLTSILLLIASVLLHILDDAPAQTRSTTAHAERNSILIYFVSISISFHARLASEPAFESLSS